MEILRYTKKYYSDKSTNQLEIFNKCFGKLVNNLKLTTLGVIKSV